MTTFLCAITTSTAYRKHVAINMHRIGSSRAASSSLPPHICLLVRALFVSASSCLDCRLCLLVSVSSPLASRLCSPISAFLVFAFSSLSPRFCLLISVSSSLSPHLYPSSLCLLVYAPSSLPPRVWVVISASSSLPSHLCLLVSGFSSLASRLCLLISAFIVSISSPLPLHLCLLTFASLPLPYLYLSPLPSRDYSRSPLCLLVSVSSSLPRFASFRFAVVRRL